MDIIEIKQKYKNIITNGANLEEYLNFEKELISNDDFEYLDFHFNIIGKRDKENLYKYLRASFDNRKDKNKVSDYLFGKYNKGIADNILKADVIQILGHLRSPFVKEIIYDEIKSSIRDIRYRCMIVMGWMGASKDLPILNERMLNDEDGELRGYGATAMRQIWYNHKSTKKAITKFIKNAIKDEDNEKALIGMIITIQDMYKKKLGIRESQYGDISGEVPLAKIKTMKVLEKL